MATVARLAGGEPRRCAAYSDCWPMRRESGKRQIETPATSCVAHVWFNLKVGLRETTIALTQNEAAFYQASITARAHQELLEEARRQRELETAQQLAETERQRAQEQAQSAQNLRRRGSSIWVWLWWVAVILAGLAGLFSQQSATE